MRGYCPIGSGDADQEILTQMNATKLISFNYEAKQWEWDMQRIAAMNVPDDVVGFLLDELDKRIRSTIRLWNIVLIDQSRMKLEMYLGSQLVSATPTSVCSCSLVS